MNDGLPHGIGPQAQSSPVEWSDARASRHAAIGLMTLSAAAAFFVYWLSAVVLGARHAAGLFGADANHYFILSDQVVNHRAARFHPITVVLGLGWMKLFGWLTPWMAAPLLLKAFFAAVGAAGVAAAASAFSAMLPRAYALLATILVGASLGVWYFAGIPESKIVTATLSMIYIAAYIHLRERWTVAGASWLSAILVAACLNEIISCFLSAIPLIDVVARHGIGWRHIRWLVPHALVVPATWLFLEIAVNGWIIPETEFAENQSHYNMLLYYLAKNDYSLASVYSYLLNWFLFNIAAPAPAATLWPEAGGYFQPSFTAYFANPISAALIAVLIGVVAVSAMPGFRRAGLGSAGGLLLGLAAYALVRMVFFFVFNPAEPMLFSPAVTLAHWMIVLVPFAASRLPLKKTALSVLAILLIATNAGFMVGPQGWANAARLLVGP